MDCFGKSPSAGTAHSAERGHLRKEGEGRYCSRCDRGEGGDPTPPLDKLGKENMMGPPQEFDSRLFWRMRFPSFAFPPLSFLHETLAEMEERGEVIIITAVSGSEARERNGEEKNGWRGEERDV